MVPRQNYDLDLVLSWWAIPTSCKGTWGSYSYRVGPPFSIPNRSKHAWKVDRSLLTLTKVFIVTTDSLSSSWSGPLDALLEIESGSLRILFQLSDQRFRELFLVRLRSHIPPIMGSLWDGLSLITCKGSDELSCHSFTAACSLAVRILSMSLDINTSTLIKKQLLINFPKTFIGYLVIQGWEKPPEHWKQGFRVRMTNHIWEV